MLAPGAFWALGVEVTIAEKRLQQQRLHLAAGSPGAVAVERLTARVLNPGVEQYVARAGIEAGHRPPWIEQAQVAEATNIEHRSWLLAVIEQRLVEGGNQGCALAARGHITAPEIGNHADPGQLSQQ